MVRLLALLCSLVLALPAQAQTYKSKAAMQAEIAAQLPTNAVGAITAAILRGVMNDLTASYDQAPGVNAQTGTTYALASTDYGQLVTFSNTGATAVSLVQATTAGFSPWNTTACNLNTGLVTITPATSTINGAATLVLGQNNCVRIVSDGVNYQISQLDYTATAVNAQTGTSYALAATDTGKLVTFSNAAATAVSLVRANTSGFTSWNTWVCNLGVGVVTITPATSTIGGNTTLVLGKGNCAQIISDSTNYQTVEVTQLGGSLAFTGSVNFNAGNADTLFNLVLPPGYANYLISAIYISGANHTLVTATCGVFTAAAGGGTAIVTGASAITVSGTTSGSANSAQSLTVIGATTVMWALASVPILYFRVATAEGAPATGSVTIVITPVS